MESKLPSSSYDFAIVGAGIIGLSVAQALRRKLPRSRVLLIEKEDRAAEHASGRNSGVLHAGVYYSEDSLKARFCIAGNRALKRWCREKELRINECGKLIVSKSEAEIPRLMDLHRRGLTNGARVELIEEREALKLEPNLRCKNVALYSPETATIDPREVCASIEKDLRDQEVDIGFRTAFAGFSENKLRTSRGGVEAGTLINCAGLYADRIAHSCQAGLRYTLLPFKGLYLKYTANKTDVRTNIYPVPDPALPFLGVHFTKTVDGDIKIGPSAIPGLWRENYNFHSRFSVKELVEIVTLEARLLAKNAFSFRSLAIEEMKKHWKPYLVRQAAELVKSIDQKAFRPLPRVGIRAQLLDRDTGRLVQDFVVERGKNSIHILNAVSPAFTCSFPFAEYVVQTFLP